MKPTEYYPGKIGTKLKILLGIIFVFNGLTGCAQILDASRNTVYQKPPYSPTIEAQKLHKSLTIVDLHADTLLWEREFFTRASRGHIDFVRLQESNVAIQVFAAVTGVPFFWKMEGGTKDTLDTIPTLAKWHGWQETEIWPHVIKEKRMQLALYMSSKLHRFIRESEGALKLVLNRKHIEEVISERKQGRPTIGALLAIEGAHALGDNPDNFITNINLLFDAGYRMLGLAHSFNNSIAGSASGVPGQGLTDKGREVVDWAITNGMIIDLSHSSDETIDDVINLIQESENPVPVVASHGGVQGTCKSQRNLGDKQLKRIAETKGVIGIGLWKVATCGATMKETVRAMDYVRSKIGIDSVALGSDFDGTVKTVVDGSGLVMLTQALMKEGFGQNEIKKILGENAIRVLKRALPSGG